MAQGLTIVSDSGLGRAFVLLSEAGQHQEYASQIAAILSSDVRVVSIDVPQITDENWKEYSVSLLEMIRSLSIRQASFVGFGAACALVQNTYLREPKLVRTMVLVNCSCRPHPTFISRCIDKLEGILPLGLPLRSSTKGFDSRSHLQRIRCPGLVVTLPDAGEALKKEAHMINTGMPTSWYVDLPKLEEREELARLIREFQEVPAKCPQKNLRAA